MTHGPAQGASRRWRRERRADRDSGVMPSSPAPQRCNRDRRDLAAQARESDGARCRNRGSATRQSAHVTASCDDAWASKCSRSIMLRLLADSAFQRPHRPEAQDVALSRPKHGFESRWGRQSDSGDGDPIGLPVCGDVLRRRQRHRIPWGRHRLWTDNPAEKIRERAGHPEGVMPIHEARATR